MKIPIKEMSYLAIVFFFSVALNPEWSSNSLLWWGSFFALLIVTCITNKFKIRCKINFFKIWGIAFLIICCISLSYALNRSASLECIKTLIVLFVVLFLIDDKIDTREEVETYMKLFLVSLFTMISYVLINVDLKSFQLAQHGEATTGLWNGNDVGMKCALFIIIILYFIDNSTKSVQQLFLLISTVPAVVLVYYTASRKAFLMVALGISLFYYLKHPTKKIRNLLVIIVGIYIAYMLMMNNKDLYAAIGWRIEGALALFQKGGKADSSALLRARYIQVGVSAWKKSPIIGYGINNYRVINLRETGHFTYSHNNYVEILVGIGLIGFILYYSYYIKLLYDYMKIYFKHQTDKILNITGICFLLMFLMQFGVVSYSSIEQMLLILFMTKAVEFNKKMT